MPNADSPRPSLLPTPEAFEALAREYEEYAAQSEHHWGRRDHMLALATACRIAAKVVGGHVEIARAWVGDDKYEKMFSSTRHKQVKRAEAVIKYLTDQPTEG